MTSSLRPVVRMLLAWFFHPVVLEHLGHTLLLQECHLINRAADGGASQSWRCQKVYFSFCLLKVKQWRWKEFVPKCQNDWRTCSSKLCTVGKRKSFSSLKTCFKLQWWNYQTETKRRVQLYYCRHLLIWWSLKINRYATTEKKCREIVWHFGKYTVESKRLPLSVNIKTQQASLSLSKGRHRVRMNTLYLICLIYIRNSL